MKGQASIKAYVLLELFDREGRLVKRRRFLSRSFLQAFLGILKVQFNNAATGPTLPDVTNTNRILDNNALNFVSEAAVGTDSRGITVGTGTAVVAITNYDLQTQIAHGVTSGLLQYQAVVFSEPTIADPNASFTIQRDFLNGSGGSITVREVGIRGVGYDSVAVARTFLLIRDLIAGGQAVADGQNLRITYTIQVST